MKTVSLITAAVALALATAACTQHVDSSESATTSEESDALKAKKPAPFALQFVDLYSTQDANAVGLTDVELRRSGTYTAWFDDGSHESGVYYASSTKDLPVSFTFITRGHKWTAKIATYSQTTLNVTMDGVDVSLAPNDTVGPNESICDDSGGTWSDDETDPNTGLFCTCNAPQVYIPAYGGCVR